ncbi:MAG: hypothetical protein HYZ73_03265, partial [Elusimicrobia bacterium]|nr:hypothetical protein [Elusimicrobiota bacterium]
MPKGSSRSKFLGQTFRTEEYRTRTETEGRWTLRVTSYRLGDHYACTVDNVDPGATLARTEGPTREEAEAQAL